MIDFIANLSPFWCFVIVIAGLILGGGIGAGLTAVFNFAYRLVVKEYMDAC